MSATASGNGWINNPDDYTCTGTSASTATAADGSGYVLSLTNYKVGTLTLASGAQATPPVNPTIASLAANNTDASGNVISSDAAGNVTDTTGNVVLSVGGTAGGNRTYTYKDMNGNSQTVTMTYKTYTVQTNFGCGGSKVVGEYGPVSTSLVDTISFPDGSAYHLSYESTPSGTSITAGSVTGRLAGVELPQGGTIQYAYNGGSNGIECADGSTAGLTRTLNSDSGSSTSTWSYTRTSPNGTGTSQTTVIDGLSNTSVYNFVEASNFTQTPGAYYETSRSIYQGAASGTPLLARTTCYNETTTSPTPCASTTTKILMPPIQIDTYETLDGIETHGATAKYNSYGLQTEADVYDFGGSTSRGALLRKEVWTYGYDIPGLVTEDDVYDGSGTLAGKTVYAYDGATPTPSSGVPRHVNVFYPRGNLTSMTQYASAGTSYTSTFTYEDTGSLLTSTTPSGTATLTYDPTFIYNTGATLPTPSSGVTLGASESFDTANTGLPLTSTDANGQITRIPSYDAMLRATETEYPDGGETTYSYSSTTATQSTLQGLGSSSTTETEYDGYGRTSRVEVANGQSGNGYYQTDTCYDGNGNASFTSYTYQGAGFGASKVCSGAGDSKTYDVLGRVTSVGRANNESRSIQYLGRAKKYVDENGVTRISQVDGLGRTTTVCEISSHTLSGVSPTTCGTDIAGTGFVTSYSYALATPTTTITQGAQTRTFQSDWLGRPTSVTEPESGTTTYSYLYTSTGLQVTRKRPRANQTNSSTLTTTTTQYDTLGRVISISYTDGTPTKTFAYDQSAGANFSDLTQANLKGRLSLASISGTAGTAYSYDPMGRTSALDECLPSGCGTVAYNRQLQYTYDLAGDVISSTDGAGVVSTYTVSPASEILSLTSSRSDATDPANLVSKVQTGPFGPVSYNLGNGLAGAYSYDALGRLSGGTVSSGDTQTYGFSNGWKGQQLTGSSDSVLNQGSTYGYDEFNRLASRTVNSGTGPNYGWVYDRYGNRLQQNITGGTGSGSTFTVSVNPANNQITTGGYAYDAAGNMTNDGFHTYTYDAEGHITAVDGGQTATYVYNALNQRVSASVGGTATEYVFNAAGKRVSEWNGATRAQIKGKYYWGALPVAYYANGAVHFEHQDWLGTERERTTYNGGVEGSYISLPFGDGFSTLTGADADANHYGTLDHDAETATDHAQFRQYSEAQGRWLSPDPYSGSYDASNPQSFNRYVYAGNNPLAAVDPSGLICFGDLRDSLPTSNCAIQELNTGTGGGGGVTTNGGQNVQDSDGNWWFLGDDGSINFVGSYPIMASGSATLPPNIDTSLMPLNYISLVPYDYSTTNSVGGSGSGSGSATNNATQQKQQTQPQHFWQKPGCGAALAEFGVGVAGTAITVGAVAAAIYLGPEMFEGIEGAATLLHIAPVGAPGLVMMGDGGFKATQTCF
jgi:RHS repeat-associated protein